MEPESNYNTSIDVVAGFTIGANCYLGCGANSTTLHSDVWEWNSVNNTWTQKANIPSMARADASSFSICGKGYLGIGGDWQHIAFADFWQYDPLLNQWIQKANFGAGGREQACEFSINNKGYIGLGSDSVPYYYNDFWEYTPDSACATVIEELSAINLEFTISPNPAKDFLIINYPLINGKEKINLTITDVNGNKVFESQLLQTLSTISLTKFSKGIYFVELSNDRQKAVKKFLKE